MSIKKCQKHSQISGSYKAIIFYARKSLLYNDQHGLMKKEKGLFNVIMPAFDKGQVCEAVGSFLLYQLSKNYNKKDIGLYRDNGLAMSKNVCGSKAERIKERYTKLTT